MARIRKKTSEQVKIDENGTNFNLSQSPQSLQSSVEMSIPLIEETTDATNAINIVEDDNELYTNNEVATDIPSIPKPKPFTPAMANAVATKLVEERKLPPTPGKRVAFDVMTRWLQALTPNQMERIIVYVYRHIPVIRRDPKYIDVLHESFDYDYMKRKFGGGKYGFWVKDTDDERVLFEAWLSIAITEHEPILNLSELDFNHKDNRSYIDLLRAQGKVDANNQVITPATHNPQTQQSTGMNMQDAIAAVRDIVSLTNNMAQSQRAEVISKKGEEAGINKTILEFLVKQMENNDPNKALASTLQLMKLIQPPPPASPPPPDNTLLTTMLTMVNSMNAQMQQQQMQFMQLMQDANGRMIEAIKSSTTNQKDPFILVERVLGLQERLGSLGRGEATEQTTFDKAMDVVERVGLPMVNVIANAIAMKNAGMPIPVESSDGTNNNPAIPLSNVSANPNPNARAVIPYNIQQQRQQQQQNQNQNRMSMQTPQSPMSPMSPQSEVIDQDLFNTISQYGMMVINSIQSGVDGASFGNNLESLLGIAVVSQIISKGEQVITSTFRAHSKFWNVVAPTPEREQFMKEWIREFVHYKEILQAEENEGADTDDMRVGATADTDTNTNESNLVSLDTNNLPRKKRVH